MTYLIDIAHPNALDDRRVVDEVHDLRDVEQCLASPSFVWNVGDIVRVTSKNKTHFTGVYSEKECIDIGPSSFMVLNRVTFGGQNRRGMSLVDMWQQIDVPGNLLWTLNKIIDTKLLTKAAVRCARIPCSKATTVKYEILACLDRIEESEDVESSPEFLALVRMQEILARGEVDNDTEFMDRCVDAVYYAALSCRPFSNYNASYSINNSSRACIAIDKTTTEQENRRFLEIVMSTISFHHVVSNIIR